MSAVGVAACAWSYAVAMSAWAVVAVASPRCSEPLVTPGGNPVIAAPVESTSRLRLLDPVLVTPVVATTDAPLAEPKSMIGGAALARAPKARAMTREAADAAHILRTAPDGLHRGRMQRPAGAVLVRVGRTCTPSTRQLLALVRVGVCGRRASRVGKPRVCRRAPRGQRRGGTGRGEGNGLGAPRLPCLPQNRMFVPESPAFLEIAAARRTSAANPSRGYLLSQPVSSDKMPFGRLVGATRIKASEVAPSAPGSLRED